MEFSTEKTFNPLLSANDLELINEVYCDTLYLVDSKIPHHEGLIMVTEILLEKGLILNPMRRCRQGKRGTRNAVNHTRRKAFSWIQAWKYNWVIVLNHERMNLQRKIK